MSGCHAEGLVDWGQGLGEHVDEGEGDGADDGYEEDNGLGEEEVDGAEEGHGEEGAQVGDPVRVEALHHDRGLLAEGLAQMADFLVEEEGRSRFADAEQETRDEAGDDGCYVEHPSPGHSQLLPWFSAGNIPIQGVDDVCAVYRSQCQTPRSQHHPQRQEPYPVLCVEHVFDASSHYIGGNRRQEPAKQTSNDYSSDRRDNSDYDARQAVHRRTHYIQFLASKGFRVRRKDDAADSLPDEVPILSAKFELGTCHIHRHEEKNRQGLANVEFLMGGIGSGRLPGQRDSQHLLSDILLLR